MECLLVKRINLDGDEAAAESSATASRGESLEDAEIANQLYNLHNKILRMFILTAFDMSRDILITPKRIMYAKKKEAELYEQLMLIAKEKQQEIKLLISSTIEQMRDRLVEQAAQYVFKENTIFNLPQSISAATGDQCALFDCCLADGQSEKCDSALQQSEEHCSCTSDEPDYPQIINQYSYPDNQHHDDDLLINNRHEASQATAASQAPQTSQSAGRQYLTVANSGNPAPGVRLRRHHSMHSQHLGVTTGRFNPYSAAGNQSVTCGHTDTLDGLAHPPQRAHSQLHNFKHCAFNQPNCTGGGVRNQANFNTQSHQYASCDYADSGCASGNCCSCEPLSVHTSDSHQRAHRNSQLVHTHSNQHGEPHYHPVDGQRNGSGSVGGSPNKKDSFLKRLTLRFNKDSPANSIAQQEKDHNQRVIEQLNELQIKDKQDYEDLRNHLNHLNHLDQLNKQAQKLDYCCNQPIYHSHPPTIVNNKQIKITLRDLCAAQNEIQEYILSLLNNQIANDIVSSVNILKKNYIGTLERTLTALESGVSSIAQREQLTTALVAAVEFDSPNKNLSIANSNPARLQQQQQQPQSTAAGQRRSAKKAVLDCTDKACRRVACPKDQPAIHCSSYMTQQNSLDCDCTLTSNSCSSGSNSSFDDAEDGESDGEDGYSFANRTHHEASDALKQILTAAYQVEINLKTNSGFFKLYWDKIRQLVFNCTVTLWKLNYANPKNVNGFCSGCCHNSLSLVNSASLLHNKTSSCHSCPPIICNSVGSSGESGASLECCELNCGCHMAITSNCEQPDCEQLWISEQQAGGGDDDETPLLLHNDRRPKFKRLRQTSLDSYVKIDEQNHFLDSHCHHPHVHNQLISAGIINSKLQFDSIIDWKRKVALEVLSNLNLARLSRSICGQFKDKLKQSHDQFAQAIRQLEQLHLEKRKRTEQQRLNLRKCFAPKIARMALESICLKDLINHGMPKLGKCRGRVAFPGFICLSSSTGIRSLSV